MFTVYDMYHWDQPDPVVRLQVREENGDVVLQQRLKLSELRRRR